MVIIIDRPKLRFLLAGRTIQIDQARTYHKGRTYPLGVSTRSAICRVVVIDIEPLDPGQSGWRVTIKRAAIDDPPLYLARPGCAAHPTPNPASAARDSTGAIEAADPAFMARASRLAAERDDLLRRETAKQNRIKHRLEYRRTQR